MDSKPSPSSTSSSPWVSKGLSKSNSTASASGRSTKSYDSVKAIGGFALGTLRIVRPDDLPRRSADDNGPPPPEPPAGSSHKRQSLSLRNVMNHDLGGGDVLIVLYLPELYTVGYDSLAFTAKHFAGIRNMPPGPHFFWACDPEGSSTRCGFWIMSTGVNRVHVVQWHSYNEVFVQPTRTETRIQAENVDKIFSKLPPFRDPSAVGRAEGDLPAFRAEANAQMWDQLTGSITRAVLDRVSADADGGWNVHTSDRVKGALRLPAEMELDRRLSHPVFQSHELRFSFEQQARTYSVARIGAARSRDAADPSSYMLSRLNDSPGNRFGEDDIVGEFQFAYVVGTYLGNDACIQQWWYMVLRLFLRAYRLIVRRPTLAAALLRALAAQLSHSMNWVQESILDYSEIHKRDLRVALIVYKRRMGELVRGATAAANPDIAAVGAAFSKLEAVTTDMGWDLRGDYLRRAKMKLEEEEDDDDDDDELEMGELAAEDERGEWAPEIVELDENGRQLGLVSWTD